MKISEVMRSGPFTVLETDCLGTAQLAMTRAHIRHLPVVSGGRLVGILSERDVLAARAHASGDDPGWWSITVHDAMQSPPQTAHPDDSLTEVAGRMAAAKIGALPVVDRGKIVGIATITDVLEAEVRTALGPPATADIIAADVMTPWPATIRPDAPLSDAVAVMVHRRIRHLPVVDRGTIVGMLSDTDLRTAIGEPMQYLAARYTLESPEHVVRDVMTASPVVAVFDVPLATLAEKFADQRVGAIPIVDKFGALLGIVSYVDALHLLAR